MHGCKKTVLTAILGSLLSIPAYAAFDLPTVDATQGAQIGCSAIEMVLNLWADSIRISPANEEANVKDARSAAILRLLAQGFCGASKGLGYHNITKDDVWKKRNGLAIGSLVANLNASVWNGVKNLEELKVLAQLQDRHGDVVPISALKPHYKELNKDCDIDLYDEDVSAPVRRAAKALLRVIKFGFCVAQSCKVGSWETQNFLLLGQAVCDGFIRFVFHDEGFISQSWIGKLEAASSVVSSGYDASFAMCNLIKGEPEPKPKPEPKLDDPDDECQVCFEEKQGRRLGRLNCGHSFCFDCVQNWFDNCRDPDGPSCPTCRDLFTMDQVEEIYI